MAMNILVTGGAGFIGSNFVHYMLKAHPDYNLIDLDLLTYAGNLHNFDDIKNESHHIFIHGDIRNAQLVDYLFKTYDFDAVVNFAAESHVDRSILHPEIFVQTNVEGTVNLLQTARKYGIKKYLQVSTDEVYGSLGKEGYFNEESPLAPNSPYSASKAAADLETRAFYETYGLNINITRTSNNYGPYQFPEKLIPLMVTNGMTGGICRFTETAKIFVIGCMSRIMVGQSIWFFTKENLVKFTMSVATTKKPTTRLLI